MVIFKYINLYCCVVAVMCNLERIIQFPVDSLGLCVDCIYVYKPLTRLQLSLYAGNEQLFPTPVRTNCDVSLTF